MRRMECLNRGLIVARAETGMYLSWRYLGDEPDGITWRVYRKRNDGPWQQLAEILVTDEPLPRTATGKIKRWELQQKAGLL